ncbi:MAG TPA: ABC transporter permease [Gemmatimonadaceae bacterium]|nr:ABC transporter permease [Gemmatimonadaceae bacterium]
MTYPAVLRSLARSRGMAAAVVLTLAVGVAALTLTFGVVHAALWRQPSFRDAERLAVMFLVRNPQGEPQRRERWSFQRLSMLHAQQRSFERTANFSANSVTLTGGGDSDAELIRGESTAAAYFQVLGAAPSQGRVYTADEDNPSAPAAVVVISHSLWRRRWPDAADATAVLGNAIRLNGATLTIIGVMPDGFRGISGQAEFWVPATLTAQLTYADYVRTNQNFISVVGRLKEGVSLADANAELAVLGATINRAQPSDPRQPDERVTATAVSLNEIRADRSVRRSLRVLMTAVVLLHLLACANVVNLLLGRAAARRHESAVRTALGSSSRRLFVFMMTDGLVLGTVGSLLGVWSAWWLSSMVTPPANVWAPRNFYGTIAPFDTPAFGAVALGFGLALAALTTMLIAIPPALSAFRGDILSGIKAGARGLASHSFSLRRPSARGLIVSIESALAILLVVAAGLLIDSYQRMRRTELGLGVDPGRVLTFWVIPSEVKVPVAAAPRFVARLLEAIERAPGVEAATVDGGGPLSGTASALLYIAGRPAPAPGQAPPVLRHYVAPTHFSTLGIPVIRGRVFTTSDVHGAPRVAVISQSAAKRFWPDEDALGKRVWFSGGSSFNSPDSSAEIVGIVGDVVYAPLDQRPNAASFYTPFAQFTYASRMVFVRAAGNAMALVPDVRRAITSVDPDVSMRDVQPLSQIVGSSWARNRFDAFLFGGFGAGAIVLAASGIFAVLAYAVATRTREFGIRIALGASAPRVVQLVLKEGLAFPLMGMAVGVAASFAVTRLLRSSLYEVSPMEPRVFALTIALLVASSVTACIVPALRAARSDPTEALRAD